MTAKKVLFIIGGIIAAGVVAVAAFVTAVVGIAFYSVDHSQAAVTAKSFLRRNEKLKRDIGEIRDFGAIVTGSLNAENSDGVATLHIKVIGERRTVDDVRVDLMYRDGREWRVTGASYKDDDGRPVDLIDAYGSD